MQERIYTLIAAFACGALSLWVILYLTQSAPDAANDKRQTVLLSPQKQVSDELPEAENGSSSPDTKPQSSGKMTDRIPADENATSEGYLHVQSPDNETIFQLPENQESVTPREKILDQIPPEL